MGTDEASDLRRRAAANAQLRSAMRPPPSPSAAAPAASASPAAPATGLHPHPLASIPLPLRPIPTEAFFDRRVRVDVPERGLRAHVYLAGLGPRAPPEGVLEGGEPLAGGVGDGPGSAGPRPPPTSVGGWMPTSLSGASPVPAHGSSAFPTPPAPAPLLSLRDRLDLPMVLCLHGAGMTGASFAPFASHLRGVAAVVAPDARGHGRTLADDPAALSLEDMARDAFAVWTRVAGLWAEGRRVVHEEEERRRAQRVAAGEIDAGTSARLSDEETERALRAAGVFGGAWDGDDAAPGDGETIAERVDGSQTTGDARSGGSSPAGGESGAGERGEDEDVRAECAPGGEVPPRSPSSGGLFPPPPPSSRSSSPPSYLPPTVILGHSMGGAVAVRAASLFPPSVLSGAIVVDVVEGSALSALASMDLVLRRRPRGFASLDAAGVWAVEHGLWKRISSLLVSLPTQLVQRGGPEERRWNHGKLPPGPDGLERTGKGASGGDGLAASHEAPSAAPRPLKRTDTPATLAVAGMDDDDVIARLGEARDAPAVIEEPELELELGAIAEGEEDEDEEEGREEEAGAVGGDEERAGAVGGDEERAGGTRPAAREQKRHKGDRGESTSTRRVGVESGAADSVSPSGSGAADRARARERTGEEACAGLARPPLSPALPAPSRPPAPSSTSASPRPPRPSGPDKASGAFAPLPPLARSSAGASPHRWVWRADLASTRPFWRDWYLGLSNAFLAVPCAKLLILAGTDRLDTPLTIGQMQGKFQLALFPDAGHAVHEDQPADVAGTVAGFLSRHGLAGTGAGVRPGAIVHGQRIHA